jgi:dihydrofolate reductase
MRKIVATEFYTIDGLMSDPKDQMDWVTATFSKDMGEYEKSMYDTSDTLLLGRVTYKIFESYWPTAETNPAAFQGDSEMALIINNIRKIVFSKSLEKLTWSNSELFTDIMPGEINKLKEQPGQDILVVGSASIVQQLTNLGLIDEYHLLIHPVILGMGKPLFTNINEKHELELSEAKTFKNGVVLLRYQPIK